MTDHQHDPTQGDDLAAARAEIDDTRAALGETVHALADKADVKAQFRAKVEDVRHRIGAKTAELGGTIAGEDGAPGTGGGTQMSTLLTRARALVRERPEAAAGVALFVGLLVGRRSRRR